MTTLIARPAPVLLPSRDAAVALNVHRDTAVKWMRDEVIDAHNEDRGQPFGAYYVCSRVVAAFRVARDAGVLLPLPRQKQLCAVCSGQARLPHVRGGARRSRHP